MELCFCVRDATISRSNIGRSPWALYNIREKVVEPKFNPHLNWCAWWQVEATSAGRGVAGGKLIGGNERKGVCPVQGHRSVGRRAHLEARDYTTLRHQLDIAPEMARDAACRHPCVAVPEYEAQSVGNSIRTQRDAHGWLLDDPAIELSLIDLITIRITAGLGVSNRGERDGIGYRTSGTGPGAQHQCTSRQGYAVETGHEGAANRQAAHDWLLPQARMIVPATLLCAPERRDCYHRLLPLEKSLKAAEKF